MINYKCPSCGAYMVYDAAQKCLVCDYCQSTQSIESFSEEELAEIMKPDGDDGSVWDETVVNADTGETETFRHYVCKNCGAEVMTDENTAATMCGFCGNPTLIEERLSGEVRPVKIIPFGFSREEAIEKFKKWTGKGSLTPKVFRSKAALEKVTGIYVPYWIYDFDVDAHVAAHATKTRMETRGDYRYTYTDHFQVERQIQVSYDKIPADASKKMPDDVMDCLEPYDYSKMVQFEMPYLSGFQADKYDYDGHEIIERASKRAGVYAEEAVMGTIHGYSTSNITYRNIVPRNTKMTYAMFPAWIVNYSYKGESQLITMNGQTGKIVGSLPVSMGRAVGWFAGVFAGSFAVVMLLLLLLG